MKKQDHYFRDVPEYYPSMYLDGYTPYEILYAKRKTVNLNSQIESNIAECITEAMEEILKDLQ